MKEDKTTPQDAKVSYQSTPQDVIKPTVVNIHGNQQEVKQVTSNANESSKSDSIVEPEKKSSKKTNWFLVILFVILFAFVLLLPEISSFIRDYQNNKETKTRTILPSGTMTCYMSKSMKEVNYTIETVFSYQKNKLKNVNMTTTHKLTDNAIDTSLLAEKEQSCQKLKMTLTKVPGMNVTCAMTDVMQQMVQITDYTKLEDHYITENIAEFEGYYPEYELDQDIVEIRNRMKQAGYTCTNNEK